MTGLWHRAAVLLLAALPAQAEIPLRPLPRPEIAAAPPVSAPPPAAVLPAATPPAVTPPAVTPPAVTPPAVTLPAVTPPAVTLPAVTPPALRPLPRPAIAAAPPVSAPAPAAVPPGVTPPALRPLPRPVIAAAPQAALPPAALPPAAAPQAAAPPAAAPPVLRPLARPAPVAAAGLSVLRPKPRPAAGGAAAAPDPAARGLATAQPDASIRRMSSVRPPPRPAAGPPVTAPPEPPPPVTAAAAPEAQPEPRPSRRAKGGAKGSVCGVAAIKGDEIARITSSVSGCGIDAPVRITSVSGVRLSQPATVDCDTARALNRWVEAGLQPAFGRERVVELRIAAHYICRPRNNVKGAKISEHGRGKAIDITAVTLETGRTMPVQGGFGKELRRAHKAACGTFGTTLGPGSDGFHEDNLHYDTASYRGGPYCR